jgi:hypothetical protein
MRYFIAIIVAHLALSTSFAQDLSGIETAYQAYSYARENMWSEVQILPKSECAFLMNPDRSKSNSEPTIGDESIVRNSIYKIVGDTVVQKIHCAVIDFDARTMSMNAIDSVRNKMILEYRRHGSFSQLAKDHLPKDELYRYQEFRDYSTRISEMLDDDFSDHRKGELFTHELTRSDDFKFLVLILNDPKEVDAFIVLKARLED